MSLANLSRTRCRIQPLVMRQLGRTLLRTNRWTDFLAYTNVSSTAITQPTRVRLNWNRILIQIPPEAVTHCVCGSSNLYTCHHQTTVQQELLRSSSSRWSTSRQWQPAASSHLFSTKQQFYFFTVYTPRKTYRTSLRARRPRNTFTQ